MKRPGTEHQSWRRSITEFEPCAPIPLFALEPHALQIASEGSRGQRKCVHRFRRLRTERPVNKTELLRRPTETLRAKVAEFRPIGREFAFEAVKRNLETVRGGVLAPQVGFEPTTLRLTAERVVAASRCKHEYLRERSANFPGNWGYSGGTFVFQKSYFAPISA